MDRGGPVEDLIKGYGMSWKLPRSFLVIILICKFLKLTIPFCISYQRWMGGQKGNRRHFHMSACLWKGMGRHSTTNFPPPAFAKASFFLSLGGLPNTWDNGLPSAEGRRPRDLWAAWWMPWQWWRRRFMPRWWWRRISRIPDPRIILPRRRRRRRQQ